MENGREIDPLYGRLEIGRGEPKPKGVEPDDDMLEPEQTEEAAGKKDRTMTKEIWKEYPEVMQEITDIAKEQGVDFKRVAVVPADNLYDFMNTPDIVFIPKNYVENYEEALKIIPKEKIRSALRIKFLEFRQELQKPKLHLYKKLKAERKALKDIEAKKANNDKELIQKTFLRNEKETHIKDLYWDLFIHSEDEISDSEIKEQVNKLNVLDILFLGFKNSDVFRALQLKNLKDGNEYEKQFLELEIFKHIRDSFPNLKKERLQKLGEGWLNNALETGKKYQEYEEKRNIWDLNKMYR